MMASTATTAIPHKAMTEKKPRNPGSTVAIIFFISMASSLFTVCFAAVDKETLSSSPARILAINDAIILPLLDFPLEDDPFPESDFFLLSFFFRFDSFAFMEAFMDELEVESEPGKGTTVRMCKKMSAGEWISEED